MISLRSNTLRSNTLEILMERYQAPKDIAMQEMQEMQKCRDHFPFLRLEILWWPETDTERRF